MNRDDSIEQRLAGENAALRARIAGLERMEETFRTFFDTAPIGTCVAAQDGRLLRVNPAFCTMLGYSRDELEQLSIVALTHPDDRAASVTAHNALLAGEGDTWSSEKRYIAKDGRAVWTQVTTRLHRDTAGVPLHFVGYIVDISEQMNARAALRKCEEDYRTLFDNAQVGMYRSRIDGSGYLAVNQAMAETFGYTREALMGDSSATRWAVPKARDEMVHVLRERGEIRNYEIDVLARNGEIRTALISARLYPSEGHIEGTIVDITELRRAQKER
ncbi:MAG: PAS domain S-box protein, partial [Deltaproteobacteria bacterium]